LTKRTVCPATPCKALLDAAYSPNIDSDLINNYLFNLLNNINIVADIIFMFVLEFEVPL
jgi:hypothetical protein